MKRALTILFSLMFVITRAHLLCAQESTYVPLPDYPFVYISNGVDTPLPVISDSLFDSSAQGIIYKVNRTELNPDNPFISVWKDEIAPTILADGQLTLRHVIIRGAASPEGPYDNNCRLSVGRVKTLLQFIGGDLGPSFDPSQVECNSICEDYAYLCTLMRRAGDPETAAVEAIWRQSGGDERYCKAQLMRLNGGATWRRLLRDYYPAVRQARVMLFFCRMPEPRRLEVMTCPDAPGSGLATIPVEPLLVIGDGIVTTPLQPVRGKRLPLVALRTNLAHDFFYMPNFGFAPSANVQLEYFPRRGHFTYNAGFTFSNHRHYADHKFFQIRDAQLELRRYFRKGHPYRGAYLAAYAHGFAYGIGFDADRGWEGEGFGAGLSAGYTLSLVRSGHLRLEAMLSVGYLSTKYDPYVWGNPVTGEADGKYYYDYTGVASKFKKRNYLFTWLGPTNLGIQLTYDIIYRKRQKGGTQ